MLEQQDRYSLDFIQWHNFHGTIHSQSYCLKDILYSDFFFFFLGGEKTFMNVVYV